MIEIAKYVQGWEVVILNCGISIAVLLVGWLSYLVLFDLLARIGKRPDIPVSPILVARMRPPARLLLPLFGLMLVTPSFAFPREVQEIVQHIFSLFFIGFISWLIINSTLASRDIVISRYHTTLRDDLKARAVYTQLTLIVKVVVVITVIISMAAMLMTFAKIRAIGVSILASAGIMGIVIGFAAQRSLSTLLAGLQIAITQPIRINDRVIVEGESGVIEEITLTYVVVKLGDLRRLIVPVTHFLEKPFQNWSRHSRNLVGTVFLYLDYSAPVPEIRAKLKELLEQSELWDKEMWELRVTDATEHVLQLRAQMSAANYSDTFSLRCEMREKLIAFLNEEHPHCLPKTREEVLK